MLTRERSLANFISATDELINSKYILADSKVGAILKAVAQSRMLYETFEYVTDGYDYAAAKSVCFASGASALPQKSADALAFVFLFLMEVDAKREDVIRVLSDYFDADKVGMQTAYADFAEKILKPFRDAASETFGKIISGEMLVVNRREEPSVDERVAEFEKKTTTVAYAITVAEDEVKRSGSDGAEELAYILKELLGALKESDSDKITLACLALKYATKSVKRPKIPTADIFNEVSAFLTAGDGN